MTNSVRERKLDLIPSPADVIAFIAAAYFFWFFAGGSPSDIFNSAGVKGIMTAAIGVGAGFITVRLLRLAGPKTSDLQRLVPILVMLGFALTAPFIAGGGFRTNQLSTFAYIAIGTVGLCVLMGWSGIGSIGNSAFAGLAAYTMAIMINEWSVSPWLGAAMGVLMAGLMGLAVGVPSLRLRGLYLAIVTMGIAVVFPLILQLDELREVTGGANGISLFSNKFAAPVDWGWLTPERWYYFLALICLGSVLFMAYNLHESAAGRAFRAVRDNEIAAAVIGIHVAQIRLLAFVISAAFAGITGILLFLTADRYVAPDAFTLFMSFDFVIAQVLGGITALAGSLLGAAYVVYIGREGLETVGRQTQEGSNVWLVLIGVAIGLLLAYRNMAISMGIRQFGPRLHSRFGVGVLNLLRLGGVAAVAVAFTLIIRKLTDEHILDLMAMRGAITGMILILFIIFAPGGILSIVNSIRSLTWAKLFDGLRSSVVSAPPPVGPTPLEPERVPPPLGQAGTALTEDTNR